MVVKEFCLIPRLTAEKYIFKNGTNILPTPKRESPFPRLRRSTATTTMVRRKESSSLSRVKVKPAQSKDEKVSTCPSVATRPHKGNCRFELPPPTSGHPPELFVETGESPIKKKKKK